MSRLDDFIDRMVSQRAILNHIRDHLDLPGDGPILEVGLGNGRTYSHLRQCFPDRRIVVFDREVAAHKSCLPDPEDTILGEIRETSRPFMTGQSPLVHSDIGTGYAEKDAAKAAWIADMVAGMLMPGGYAVSDLPLEHPQLVALPLPDGASPRRGYFYRRT